MGHGGQVIEVLAFIDALVIVIAYLAASITHRWRYFHATNVLGAPVLIWSEALVGAWGALVLTAAFGVIGLVGLVRE